MAWSAPRTWTTGEIVTAAQLNQEVRDNLLAVNIPHALGAQVAAAQTTTSTTYVDLATVGPSVTLVTGTLVYVQLSAELNHNSVRHYMSVEVSGATTMTAAAVDTAGGALLAISADGYADVKHSYGFPLTVTAGSNTFTAKYKSGGGTITCGLRSLAVFRTTAVS